VALIDPVAVELKSLKRSYGLLELNIGMKKIIKWLISLNILVALVWGGWFAWNTYQRKAEILKQRAKELERNEKAGYMTVQNSEYLATLTKVLDRTGRMSDTDTAWLCEVIQSSLKKDYMHGALDRLGITFTLRQLKQVTPSQREKLYQAMIPMTRTPDGNDEFASDRIGFCNTMVIIKETKAVEQMLLLLNDPRSKVKKRAEDAIQRLQKIHS
jgi:hypothetical protein